MITSVDELNKNTIDGKPTQTISLSALTKQVDQPAQSSININSTNGLNGASEDSNAGRPVVKISSAGKRSTHRSIEENEHVETVDPTTIIPPPPPKKAYTPREKAVNELADAIGRKKAEYDAFIKSALEADAINRQKIEDGLEEVQGELEYLPEDVIERRNEIEPVVESSSNDDEIKSVNLDNEEDYEEEDTQVEEYDEDDDISGFEFEPPILASRNDEAKNEEEYINDEEVEEIVPEESIPLEETEYPKEEDDSELTEELEEDYDVEDEEDTIDTSFAPSTLKDNLEISPTITVDSFNIDDDDSIAIDDSSDIDDEDEEELSSEDIQEIFDKAQDELREEVLKKIVNAGKTLNTSQYVVSKKVISIKDAIKNSKINDKPKKTGSWPLMGAGRPFVATPLKGSELALLVDLDRSGVVDSKIPEDQIQDINIQQLKIIYEHDANPYKPATVEAWAKTIPYWDYPALFGALYVASLDKSNYLPIRCQKSKCQHVHLTDNINPRDIVVFGNEEVEKKFDEILKVKLTPENSTGYSSVINVINDSFAVGVKVPSLYTILYESNLLDADFQEKYGDIISIISFIDYIYYIDSESGEFIPIGWKKYPGDYTKTFKSKISTYAKIIKEFSNTDFSVVFNLMTSITVKDPNIDIYFRVPETTCPKCGSNISETPIDIRYMLFIPRQLVMLATLPTES